MSIEVGRMIRVTGPFIGVSEQEERTLKKMIGNEYKVIRTYETRAGNSWIQVNDENKTRLRTDEVSISCPMISR